MNTRQKNIAKAGWELVVALFVFFGTFFMAFAKIIFDDFISEKKKTKDNTVYISTNDNTMIGYGSDTPEIIENVTDKS